MVRLNDAQKKFIVNLKTAREAQQRQNAYIDSETRVKKEAAKQPVAALVREALAAGVPARQIAVSGLGYADVNSLKQYLEPGNTNSNGHTHVQPSGSSTQTQNVPLPESVIRATVGPHPITIREVWDGKSTMRELYVTDSFGDELTKPFVPFVEEGRDYTTERHYDPKYFGERTDWEEIEQAVVEYMAEKYDKRLIWED